ncbi:tetratricopeptide repeat protein [Tamlana agarivorans]|uniref:Tetratricopeptide repeat protein n=1 Tax=Pseudotamlana agarivorans TaxID=481183 RepID=A0ACC5U7T7_9FLAO|nr:tetratricopeptide repeat protein [Tamlana agarivorans]MBU2950357.1 tetratricopeptide repeat protein [Tamlana agarivorans]
MKHKIYIFYFLFGILIFPSFGYAQVDFNKKPDDDLGNHEDEFQELFYEALKQKGIENYDRAAEALKKCIKMDKSVPVLYFELGKCYNHLKNFGAAEDALKKAVDKDPDNEWFLDELYGYYAAHNEHDKAIKTVKQLVKYHPDYKEDLAGLYARTEKYDDALKILDALDAEFGTTMSRDIMRNKIYEATGNTKDRIENLEARVENNPEKESNYLALIFRYSENNEKDKAFETAKELLKINPNSQLVHMALYKFYLDDNETAKAVESMKIVVKSNEIKPDTKMKVLTDFMTFVKAHPEFEADLMEATALVSDSNTSKTVMELGQYYLAKGDKEKALTHFETALRLEPNNFNMLRNVMLLYIDLGHYEQARALSAESLEKFPSQPLFYLVNGVSSNKLNAPKAALESLEMGLDFIIEDSKMEADFYVQMSQAYTLLNNTAKAKTFSDKAKQIQSSN